MLGERNHQRNEVRHPRLCVRGEEATMESALKKKSYMERAKERRKHLMGAFNVGEEKSLLFEASRKLTRKGPISGNWEGGLSNAVDRRMGKWDWFGGGGGGVLNLQIILDGIAKKKEKQKEGNERSIALTRSA